LHLTGDPLLRRWFEQFPLSQLDWFSLRIADTLLASRLIAVVVPSLESDDVLTVNQIYQPMLVIDPA
jgi:hypothetical protein